MNSKALLDQDCSPDNIKSVQACALGTCFGWRDASGEHGKCVFRANELKTPPAAGGACSDGLVAMTWKGALWCLPKGIELCASEQAAPAKRD